MLGGGCVQHLSARASVEEISRAKAAGVPVTCEASPHHLTLTDEAVRSLDARFKMNPPLRSEDDRQALIDGLRDGTIDCVATDHAPHSEEEKEVPFEEAAMGVTGLETAFAALHTDLVLPGVLALELVVERMTCGGEPFGIEAPRIEPGATANVALIDSGLKWNVGEEGYESRSHSNCFGGRGPARCGDGRGRAGRVPPAQLRPGGPLEREARAARTTLIVVDVREGFRKAIPDFERIAKATATLIEGAGDRDSDRGHRAVPEGAWGDRPGGGRPAPRGTEPLKKVCFSAAEADDFDLGGQDQALVCGIETHVCVNQTVLDLLESGTEVQVAEDAVASRFEENKRVGLQKMEGRARSDQCRDRALRAPRPGRHRRVQADTEADRRTLNPAEGGPSASFTRGRR